ncbi:MAG: acyl-CoA dehydrogenase, partial [Planctomycetota bacterium]
GDGLTIAYHGLNLGRVSLCAAAAGTMRSMLADMLPWAHYRCTYGQPIERRELVRRRIAMLAGYITACDALTDWCANLIDRGFRGEMECIVAKIFGSEAQKSAAIELYMKTHGGRAFLHGHFFGDNVHEFLAPCIYEGEGEMLGMAFFKSLVKHHGKRYFEPIGRALVDAGLQQPNLLNPRHAWLLRRSLADYAAWWVGQRWMGSGSIPAQGWPAGLRRYAQDAAEILTSQCFDISAAMRTHQLKLADRQCSMIHLGSRVQSAVVLLVTAAYAANRPADSVLQSAAEVLCGQLWRELTGSQPTNADFRRMTELGARIAEEGWSELEGIPPQPILMRYDDR